ncbi:hypothetical protein F2P79_010247 [Pimephales promelas]|nr:hypothetical protein F2P79_010247 [Pimephales promelas]
MSHMVCNPGSLRGNESCVRLPYFLLALIDLLQAFHRSCRGLISRTLHNAITQSVPIAFDNAALVPSQGTRYSACIAVMIAGEPISFKLKVDNQNVVFTTAVLPRRKLGRFLAVYGDGNPTFHAVEVRSKFTAAPAELQNMQGGRLTPRCATGSGAVKKQRRQSCHCASAASEHSGMFRCVTVRFSHYTNGDEMGTHAQDNTVNADAVTRWSLNATESDVDAAMADT